MIEDGQLPTYLTRPYHASPMTSRVRTGARARLPRPHKGHVPFIKARVQAAQTNARTNKYCCVNLLGQSITKAVSKTLARDIFGCLPQSRAAFHSLEPVADKPTCHITCSAGCHASIYCRLESKLAAFGRWCNLEKLI